MILVNSLVTGIAPGYPPAYSMHTTVSAMQLHGYPSCSDASLNITRMLNKYAGCAPTNAIQCECRTPHGRVQDQSSDLLSQSPGLVLAAVPAAQLMTVKALVYTIKESPTRHKVQSISTSHRRPATALPCINGCDV